MQVAVFLHVEVDKFGPATAVGQYILVLHGLAIQDAQAILDGGNRLLTSHQVDLTKYRRDFDRNIFDIWPTQEGEIGLETPLGLLFAQNRFTEVIDVETHAVLAPFMEVGAEPVLLRGHDEVPRLMPQFGHDQRHDQVRQVLAKPTPDAEGQSFPPRKVSGPAI